MKIIKHNGNGQTYCVGCLAAGRQPLNWDSWITEIQYEQLIRKIADILGI